MHICNFSWYAVSSNSLLTPIQYTYSISLQLCQAWQQLLLPACASLVYLSCLSARERPPGRGAHRHTTPPASLPANRPFFILYGSYKNYETARIFRKAKERKLWGARAYIHTYVHTLTHKDFCTECINPNCTVVFYTLQNCTFSSMEAGERTKVPLNVNFAIFFFFSSLSLFYFSA